MQPKHPWLQKSLKLLEELPQIKAISTVEPYLEEVSADGCLTIQTPDHKLEYIVEIKSNLSFSTLEDTIQYFHYLKKRLPEEQRPLLITDFLPDEIIDELLQEHIEFIDTSGNIYINQFSIYILIRKNITQKQTSILFSPIDLNTLKLAFYLLKNPEVYSTSLQRLSEASQLDITVVKSSLENLYRNDYLLRQQGEGYRIKNYVKLLERWEIGYGENLQSELFLGKFKVLKEIATFQIFEPIKENIPPTKYLIGGELGAAILTKYLKPMSAVIYLKEAEEYRLIMKKLQLVPDPKGNITMLRQFGNKNDFNDFDALEFRSLVDPLLIHAELSLYPDDRLKETARRIYSDYIANREKLI